jgi:O-antigen biosynthesis protein
VIDDGSSDATAAIARSHDRARVISIEHAGLSVARNIGYQEAKGDIVAYLDSDAYPIPEWPYLLALGFDGPDVGGAGGPNVPPRDDAFGAQAVARAPGGPVHVLTADDRAEHVPGCNMAFWKMVLDEVGGFDPVYRAAGDDVDLCWKVLNRGWKIGFHPAAAVWHHRRPGVRTYARQQRGYGRAEALVQARHPDQFTPLGSARWRGSIYDSFAPRLARQRIYRGLYGSAAYQSVYRGGGHTLDILHQAGIPVAAVLVATLPLGFLATALALPGLAGLIFVAALAIADAARVEPPRRMRRRGRFRGLVALLHIVQPLARIWGRLRASGDARRDLPPCQEIPGPVQRQPGGVLMLPLDRARADLVPVIVDSLRRRGLTVVGPTGWEDHDAVVIGSSLVEGQLVSSAFPEGTVQVRVRPALRGRRAATALALVAAAALVALPLGALSLMLVTSDAAIGLWRVRATAPSAIAEAAAA